jgi:hypothetical protein
MADKYRLRRCRECGLPRYVNYFVRWNDNGTITQKLREDFRVVILHYGFIHGLFPHIGERLGLPIDHIAFEAQRNAAKAVFEAFYDKIPLMRSAARLGFVKRLAVEQFNKVGALTGMCYSETLEYDPGNYGVARVRSPFDINLMAGNVVGAFEVLDGIPFWHTLEQGSDDSYIIRIEATWKKPEISERMAIEYPKMLPGDRKLERCGRCGAPLALRRLRWVENDGFIIDKKTGDRIVMLDGYVIGTVFREMAKELGDEVNDILVDARREWTVGDVVQLGLAKEDSPVAGEEREKAYREYMDIIALYGQGNPVSLEIGDSRIKVEIENPYEPVILLGSLEGLYEALEKRKARAVWERTREGAVSYTVDPA